MESLYQNTNWLLQKVQHELGRLEASQNEQDAQMIVQSIYTDVKWVFHPFTIEKHKFFLVNWKKTARHSTRTFLGNHRLVDKR